MATSNLAVQNWFETTLSSSISSTDTTISINTVPTGSEGYLIIEPDSSTNREVIYYTSKTSSAVILPSLATGRAVDGTSAIAHASGATVRMEITSGHWNSFKDGSAFTDGVINTSKLNSASEFMFDFVASGCIWTADAAGSTRNASMTSGVVYISGKRIAVSAVTAHSFTASKDTYVDIDGTGTVTYAESTNNAASQALAAGSIRVAIIVTGASNIAAATSINQGQETMVLPIASSIPYAVTDSLGNLICPRDPNRKILGYRQIVNNFNTSSATAVQITGLSVPVIIPTGRKIKVSAHTSSMSNSSASSVNTLSLWDGVVASGTLLESAIHVNVAANATVGAPASPFVVITPTSTSKTYNAGLTASAGTAQVNTPSSVPISIMVELV